MKATTNMSETLATTVPRKGSNIYPGGTDDGDGHGRPGDGH